jgi:hypothetical protein
MTPLGSGEMVWVEGLGLSGAPAGFTWRGRRHSVRQVESWRQAGSSLRLYRVRTAGGMRCLISLDSRREIWRMERVLPLREG